MRIYTKPKTISIDLHFEQRFNGCFSWLAAAEKSQHTCANTFIWEYTQSFRFLRHFSYGLTLAVSIWASFNQPCHPLRKLFRTGQSFCPHSNAKDINIRRSSRDFFKLLVGCVMNRPKSLPRKFFYCHGPIKENRGELFSQKNKLESVHNPVLYVNFVIR